MLHWYPVALKLLIHQVLFLYLPVLAECLFQVKALLVVQEALEIPETLDQARVTPVLVVAVVAVVVGQVGLIFAALFNKMIENLAGVEVEVEVLRVQIEVQAALLPHPLAQIPVMQGVRVLQVIPAALRVTPAMLET